MDDGREILIAMARESSERVKAERAEIIAALVTDRVAERLLNAMAHAGLLYPEPSIPVDDMRAIIIDALKAGQ